MLSFFKKYYREIILFVLFFIAASVSFILGYLYATEVNPTPIIIEKNSP